MRNIDHAKCISSEWLEKLIEELDAVQVYEDNYTVCQNAAYAIRALMSPYVAITEED